MKQVGTLILVLVQILVLLVGCSSNSEVSNLHICGSYAVPGLFYGDLKGNVVTCKVIERDSYGRILFCYTAPSIVNGENKTAYVICQQTNADYVYYYEDVCYIVGEATEERIDALKQSNDWEESLNESKMVCRSNELTYDMVLQMDSMLDYGKLKDVCIKEFGVEASQVKELCFLDRSVSNQELLWLSIEINGLTANYYLLANTDYSIYYEAVESADIDQEEVVKFKQKHGWEYVIVDQE